MRDVPWAARYMPRMNCSFKEPTEDVFVNVYQHCTGIQVIYIPRSQVSRVATSVAQAESLPYRGRNVPFVSRNH